MSRQYSLLFLLMLSAPLSAGTKVYPFCGCAPITIPESFKNIHWFLWPEKTAGKDSLTESLLLQLDTCRHYPDSVPFIVGAALSHHLLCRLGRDSSITEFTRTLDILEKRGYRSSSLSLLTAAHSITSGDLVKGLLAIDSVRTVLENPDSSFMKDCLYILGYSFIPVTILHPVPVKATLPVIGNEDSRLFGIIPLREDETTPASVKWSLHEALHPLVASGVSFSAQFNLTTTPTLRIPLLHPVRTLLLSTTIDSAMEEQVIDWTVTNPFNTTAPMELSIAVYPGLHKTSLDEFMYAVVAGNFDQVRQVKTLSCLKSLSVRCRTYHVTSAGGGVYSAFILFDAGIYSTGKTIRIVPPRTWPKKAVFPVRYLLSMRADRHVEQKAEQILDNIVKLFEQRL